MTIWRLLNGTRGYTYYKKPWLTIALDKAGNALAGEVKYKDVVRQGDVFQWIEPVTINQSAVMSKPGETIMFKAQLTDASGTPRPSVRVLFTAVPRPDNVTLDSAHMYPAVTHTDSSGIAAVTVKVPDDMKNGEASKSKQ